jgi:hypothetical protein
MQDTTSDLVRIEKRLEALERCAMKMDNHIDWITDLYCRLYKRPLEAICAYLQWPSAIMPSASPE